ncbi:hypothetical protein DSC45_01525 [Streptomyces sp. YIM 130001]|uniref:hypothetical protein n=1 Tax=Streptomyces sp. YIM 130001 TaxID=2259644 RepID=UPI000E6528F3|nr:hypothetical protein [Streptomyces sp. YIM 130001]RII21071.1 hypothetical protein DSC45_01525 [Streptomyces sp. YIM 130001]
MSYGDPNNPYGQPPQQPPGGQPGYGYPQQAPPPQGQPYGYPPQQQGYPGYPGYPGGPGGNMMQQSMPGLLMTARVFLFLISAVQIIGALGMAYLAAFASDISSSSDDLDVPGLSDGADFASGVAIIFALVFAGLATLSILLGVKFSNGGQGIRVTTIVYGAIGTLFGLLSLVSALDVGSASGIIFPILWLVFAVIITLAPAVSSGGAWFSRPRY